MFKYLTIGLAIISVVLAQRKHQQYQQPQQQYQQPQQYQSATTPVPILRQINTHNQDGSYTYGYEAADGSYKIENKVATGEVKGKYGYYDDVGQLREIEYGATRDGFNPSGTGINVPPHVPANRNPGSDYDDDGQYRPDVHTYPYDYIDPNTNSVQQQTQQRLPSSRGLNFPQPQQQQTNNYYQEQEEYIQPAPVSRPRPRQHHHQQQQQQQAYNRPPRPNNQYNPDDFRGHPAKNINIDSGSYSVNY